MSLRVEFSIEYIFPHIPSTLDVFEKVVAPARAVLGVGNLEVSPSSSWSQKYINTNDPVEVVLAGRLHNSALTHVEASTIKAYAAP